MVCPLCRSRMVKMRRPSPDEPVRGVRCVRCLFSILFRGLAEAA